MREESLERNDAGERRFSEYLEAIAGVLGHADRRLPVRGYVTGLLLPGPRKSVEPMAARIAPQRVQAAHQSLHHVIAQADWSNEAVLDVVRARVLPAMERHGPIQAWIVDATGFPKKGRHSVGVARQYCGQLGKVDNCQVAVTLSLANDHASLPVACRLYLPEAWADDPVRRARAGVPADVAFQTKPAIALDQIRAAVAADLPRGLVLSDAGYGNDTRFRDEVSALGLLYALGLLSSTLVWPPGLEPQPVQGQGRPSTRRRRDADHRPVSAKDLALSLPKVAFRRVAWREGSKAALASRFAALRVRPAHHDPRLPSPRPRGAGGSSVTIRNSSRNSGSAITRAAAGGAFTTTPRCASRPMASSSPSEAFFPLTRGSVGNASKPLQYPKIINRAALPVRAERHNPTSIASIRRRMIHSLARHLPRCPCCLTPRQPRSNPNQINL